MFKTNVNNLIDIDGFCVKNSLPDNLLCIGLHCVYLILCLFWDLGIGTHLFDTKADLSLQNVKWGVSYQIQIIRI